MAVLGAVLGLNCLVSTDARRLESLESLYRPFRAFIRTFGNWSAQQPPIFSIASENSFFMKKMVKFFLGGPPLERSDFKCQKLISIRFEIIYFKHFEIKGKNLKSKKKNYT